ncbi:MAG: hypothetical protein H0V67_02955, partial [Geodermatophilaceae bacterium]|nr:hypothetical protein [Geodermatophilaceae bacterium]
MSESRRRPHAYRSDEGSLILAVLLALMVISLVLTMAVGILAGQDKTRTARDFAT